MKMYFQDDEWGAKPTPQQPPRRSGGSRMHPGWACFMLAWWSGIFTAMAMAAAVQWARMVLPVGFLIFVAAIAIGLFILGGRRAEKLWERE